MADYTMSDYLQGRNPWDPRTLQEVQAEMQRNGEIEPPDFGAAMPQSEAEWQHHSPASLWPYASVLPPVAAYNAGQSLTRGVMDRDPWAAARGVAEAGLSMAPVLGPMRTPAASTRTVPQAAPSTPPPAPTGPWQPGHMNQWLQGRYQPAARPQAWQADRRWGSPGNEQASLTWRDVVAGRIRAPQNRAEMIEAAKGAGAAGAAGGVGGAAGMYLTDRLYHERPWQEASWRALAGPSAGEPPSWWPQPPANTDSPPPPSGPQPPSRLRSGW